MNRPFHYIYLDRISRIRNFQRFQYQFFSDNTIFFNLAYNQKISGNFTAYIFARVNIFAKNKRPHTSSDPILIILG